MKIVVAPNAFKGSLTAGEAAKAMDRGIKNILPDANVIQVPVADGGDGLVDVAVEALQGKTQSLEVQGPRYATVLARYCVVESLNLATIEMALASGLTLLPTDLQDPTLSTTYGTGELIKKALDLQVARINVGIGGSATNDGGMGMAQALGIRFLDKTGAQLPPIGKSLLSVAKIDVSDLDPRIHDVTIEAVCDVDNPLFGRKGAAYVYAPQKGATAEQVEELDRGLQNLGRRIQEDLGIDVNTMPGAGAAGGLGAGLHAFLGARLCKGIDLIFDLVGLPNKLSGADLVLTGEGQIDCQTVFGKAPAGVGAAAKAQNIPCFAIAGSIGKDLGTLHDTGINAVFSLCPGPISLEESMQFSKENISRITEQAVRAFLSGKNK